MFLILLVKEINYNKIKTVKPILKWVGGKTQIIDKLIVEFPTEINNYREIFLGGGSVLLTLLSYVKSGIIKIHGNIYAYDLNEPLIYIYKNIQTIIMNYMKIYRQLLQSLINVKMEKLIENRKILMMQKYQRKIIIIGLGMNIINYLLMIKKQY